jgi:parallel beta-helix repeat protein
MGKSRFKRWFPRFLCAVFVSLLLFSSFAFFQAQAAAPPPGVQLVDSFGRVGLYASLALDYSDNAHISYYDISNNDLKYAAWTGTGWNIQTVDSEGFVGLHTSVALDSGDNPHISYYAGYALKFASWNGTAWNIQTVDSGGSSFTSLAFDKNGYPHISYFHVPSGGHLRYASWTGSSWSIEVVDSAGIVGEFTSLALDAEDKPHISYYDALNGDLKYAWLDSSGWNIQTVDASEDVGKFSSLVLDSSGIAHIGYCDATNGDLKYAESTGSSWNIQVVATGNCTDSSLALDSNGKPHISYDDNSDHHLKYASWDGSGWSVQILDSAGYVGEYTSLMEHCTSLKIDRNDNAHIAFCDAAYLYLKYAVIANSSETPTQNVQTFASINVRPDPVGVGQIVLVNMAINPIPPTSIDRFSGLTLVITRPDGTVETLGPFFSDSHGLVYTSYVPTEVGVYNMRLKYSGEFFSTRNMSYLPSESSTITLRVQEEPTSKVWTVDDDAPADFSSIQAAVNAAYPGDYVFVRNGIYREPQVTIRKPLTLEGEFKTSTIIDGDTGSVRLYVQSTSNVVVRGFTVRNGYGIYSAFSKDVVISDNIVSNCPQGIILIGATNNTISKNVITNSSVALLLSEGSNDNTVSENLLTRNSGDSICLDHSNGNTVSGNIITNNGLNTSPSYHVFGIRLSYSNNNVIFHNDLLENFEMADGWMSIDNMWDNGKEGNYWSDYSGADETGDGIGDTPYVIDTNNTDRYPLMKPFSNFLPTPTPSPSPPPAPTPSPTPPLTSALQQKGLTILKEVVGIEVSRYTVTAEEGNFTYPGGVPIDTVFYTLTSDNSRVTVSLDFTYGNLMMMHMLDIEGPPYLTTPQTNANGAELAQAFLSKYQTYTGDPVYGQLMHMLDGVDLSQNISKISGNAVLEATGGERPWFKWYYTANGANATYSKAIALGFKNGFLEAFVDKWQLYQIGSNNVNISEQQAKTLALEAAKTHSWNIKLDNDTFSPENFSEKNIQWTALIFDSALGTDGTHGGGSLTLYPVWRIGVALNKWYGNMYGIEVDIWADTGEVQSVQEAWSMMPPPESADSAGSSSSSSSSTSPSTSTSAPATTPSAEPPDQESSQRYAQPHSTGKTGALPDSTEEPFPMLIIAIVTAVAAIIALLICYSKYQEQQFQRRWEERKQ